MTPFSLNIRGRLVEYGERPLVMGIVNITPDSYFTESRAYGSDDVIAARVGKLMAEGADMLDIGGFSTRPGADEVSPEEEAERLERGLRILRREAGSEIPVSVDTFRASIAREAVQSWGADIVNDVSGGCLDPEMLQTVAELHVPYILMHMRGTPQTMGSLCDYPDGVVGGVLAETARRVGAAALEGIADIIVDPGFGFSKTVNQNWELMENLSTLKVLRRPILVGVSRKSMLTRALGIATEDALNATTALHAFALDRGADILRVHDVRAARETVEVYTLLQARNS